MPEAEYTTKIKEKMSRNLWSFPKGNVIDHKANSLIRAERAVQVGRDGPEFLGGGEVVKIKVRQLISQNEA